MKCINRPYQIVSIVLTLLLLMHNTSTYAASKINNQANIAPSASFSVTAKKKVDIIVVTDYTGAKLGKLNSAITDFKADNLSKYDIRSVVENDLPKIDLGTQAGSYNVGVYGIVGTASYVANISGSVTKTENATMSVCLNPTWVYPGQTPPSGSAIVPTTTNKTFKNYSYLEDRWTYDIYTFTNNSGMNYTYYPFYADDFEHSDTTDTPEINCGYLLTYALDKSFYTGEVHSRYSMATTPSKLNFTFKPDISFFRNEGKSCTNTVKALNLTSDELKARESSQAFYILAMDGTSTDFYQSSIYNSDNRTNYMLGNLRSDNLATYIKDSNAVVLADVDPSVMDMSLGNVTKKFEDVVVGEESDGSSITDTVTYYQNGNMRFENTTLLQNLSLNQLLQYGSDGRAYDKNEIDGAGVIGRLDYFMTQGKDKIDLTIVTDKDTSYANSVSNLVKSSVGDSVDLHTTIVGSSSARKTIGQRTYYNFKSGINLDNTLLKIGDKYNNIVYDLGPLKNVAVTSASVAAINDNTSTFSFSMWPNGYDEDDASGKYTITQDGDLYITEKYFSYYLESSTERSGFYYKLDRSGINNEKVKSIGFLNYGSYYNNTAWKKCYISMYVTTENNNLYLLFGSSVYKVCSDVYTTTQYTVSTNSRGDIYKDVLVGVKKSGEAYEIGYRTDLSKYCDAKSSPINRFVYGHVITDDNTSYDTLLKYLSDTPSSQSYSNWLYKSQKYDQVVHQDGTVNYYVSNGNGGYIQNYASNMTFPQGKAVKIESYPDIHNNYYSYASDLLVKLSDNSVVNATHDYTSISETNYTDFLYFNTNYREYISSGRTVSSGGTLFTVDVNGNVYIRVFDNDYDDKKFVDIKLQDDIAQKILDKRVVNVESFNNDLVKAASLREGADRIMVYISDKFRTQVGAGAGTYFPWGGINSDLKKYLQDNNYAVYFITPEEAMSARFIPPYISNYYGGTLNNLCYADIYDSYRFDSTDQVAAYISNRYGITSLIEDPNGIYLIQGEDTLSYSIKYNDYEGDPMNALRWKFTHTPTYFENGNGLNPYSGQWLTTFNESPTQVGKYVIECEAQDRPIQNALFKNYWLWGDKSEPQNVYVHRRPIADFSISLSHAGSGYNTSINDNSYDLDRLSTDNRGIIKWKWKYRVQGDTEWIYGRVPSYLDKGPVYEVYLEVLDKQGAWSKPKIVLLDTTAVNLTPTVDADPATYGWTNQNIYVTVTADDNGENDFKRTTYKSTTSTTDPGTVDGIMYQKVFPLTYTAEGIWYLHMHVFDTIGNTSYRYRGPYKIDKTAPGGTAVPYEHAWTNQDISMSFSPWDALSGVEKWRYRATDNGGASWGSWSGYAWGAAASTVSFNYEGLHVLQSEVTDNAGNVGYVTTGRYLIDKTAPIITADIDGPVEVYDTVTVNLSLTDNLSGVKETRYCFANSTERPEDGWLTSAAANIPAKYDKEGVWYLHVECEDNAGNISYAVFGSYEIIIVRIFDLTVTMINDITWRDYYFKGTQYNTAGKATEFVRRSGTDIKADQMPINYYNDELIVNYEREGIDSGCEVSFYLRSVGNPENVTVYAYYITNDGTKVSEIKPIASENQLWQYKYVIPLECLSQTYISFDVEAEKNGKIYGTDRWLEPWLPLNTERNIFYISGNAVDRLKFNQSH